MPTKRVKTADLPPGVFSIQQTKALEMLVGGALDREVGAAIGVDSKTIWKWRNYDERFAAELAELQRACWDEAKRKLKASVTSAVRVLCAVMEDDDTPAAARVAAAKDILDRAGLVHEKEAGVTIDQASFDALVDKLATERAEQIAKGAK